MAQFLATAVSFMEIKLFESAPDRRYDLFRCRFFI